MHNRSINFVKTFIEIVEETCKELKKDLINYKPKKKNEIIEDVTKEVVEFIPCSLLIIRLFWVLIGRIKEYSDKKQLSNQIQLHFKNWTNALVKCAVDILYSYEEYLFKAKTMGDVKKLVKNAASRVLKYNPGNDEDLDTDKCYKRFLKSLILAEVNDETEYFVFNEPPQELLEKEVKVDDIFEKASVFESEKCYQRYEKQSWNQLRKVSSSNIGKYGCRRMLKCPGIETLCYKESSISDNDISYCFDETLTCYYQWEFDLNDENSFLILCKKYSRCAKSSLEIIKEEMKELIQSIADQMQ